MIKNIVLFILCMLAFSNIALSQDKGPGKDSSRTQIELLKKESDTQQQIIEEQKKSLSVLKALVFVFVLALVVVLAIIGFYYNRYRYRMRMNSLLQENSDHVLQQKLELISKTRELDNLNAILKIQNQKTTSSIIAAKSIQDAILPFDYRFDDVVQDFFLLFRPKDIVSGDFYWMTQAEHRTFLAVIDCTGHGVPGAFMSMLGYALLNEIVNFKGVYEPSTILELLHIAVKKSLKQDHLKDQSGMDVCLIRIDKKWNDEYEVIFSGAKRPLHVVSSGEMKKYRGNRISIGGRQSKEGYKEFTHEVIDLKPGDLIYLSSDGYVDTPNTDRERLGNHRYDQVILENHHKPLKEQKEVFEQKLAEFQGTEEQRDDITILGIRL